MRLFANDRIPDQLREYTRYAEIKQLTQAIAALQQEKMLRSLAILSFFAAEGKTLFAAVLALSYADLFRCDVLLVDTTTRRAKNSLTLRHCIGNELPSVEVVSLRELRSGSNGTHGADVASRTQIPADKKAALHSEIVQNAAAPPVPFEHENDVALIKRAVEDRSKRFGLVVLDTTPIDAKNRHNVDPLLVARLSDASVLVASRKFLDAPNLAKRINLLDDPTLHLAGVISNEEFNS